MHEYKSVDILRETFAEYNLNHVDDSTLEKAVEAFFEPEETLYSVVMGAYAVLQILKNRGYKLALVSNASSGELVRSAMKRRDFRNYFRLHYRLCRYRLP